MARGVNKAILLGNLGHDPEVRYTSSGACVANVSLATTKQWRDKTTGERQERTEWHKLVFWNKLAEVVAEYCTKGMTIYVEGEIKTEKWQDQSGQDRYTTKIECNEMQMLGGGRDNSGRGQGSDSGFRNQQSDEGAARNQTGAEEDFQDDDIPF